MTKLILAFCIITLISSCVNHDEKKLTVPADLVIKIGQQCGWCAGYDSLMLTSTQSDYEYHAACDGQNKSFHQTTNMQRWDELLQKLDLVRFRSIEINTCNLCADGCDIWISIQKDDVIHTIRFGEASTEINSIKSFVDALNSWRKEFEGK